MTTCQVCRGTGVNPASDNLNSLPCDTCRGTGCWDEAVASRYPQGDDVVLGPETLLGYAPAEDEHFNDIRRGILAHVELWRKDLARLEQLELGAETARHFAFAMQQSAMALQGNPDTSNAVSASWVIAKTGYILSALAFGRAK